MRRVLTLAFAAAANALALETRSIGGWPEFRQNDTGAAGRGALTDKRKDDIRKHLLNRTFV